MGRGINSNWRSGRDAPMLAVLGVSLVRHGCFSVARNGGDHLTQLFNRVLAFHNHAG